MDVHFTHSVTWYHEKESNVCLKKTVTIHSSVISHNSKSIWVIKLAYCQNGPPMGESFWKKDSLITHILFELWLITLLWIVTVFLKQTLQLWSYTDMRNGILLPTLFWPTVRKKCFSDRGNFLNSRLKAKNLQNFWDQ